jgi:hypothetical protein
MSALGQKQTSPHVRVMSASPGSGIAERDGHVRFVPKADIRHPGEALLKAALTTIVV